MAEETKLHPYTLDTELTGYMPVPREMIQMQLPSTAVLIYGALLDRGTLSRKNHYTDEAGQILAVGALLHEDERWPVQASAYYLHHLASRVDAKGAGSVFLNMAEDYTARMGKRYMRLDSAVGNKNLEHFYASRGYVEAGFCKDGLYEGILRQKKLK